MPAGPPRPDGLTLAAFAALLVLGGGNAVGVRFTNEEMPPLWGAAVRFGVAALLFFVIAAAKGIEWPRGRALLGPLAFGAVNFAGGYALVYWGLVALPAGLAQVILGLVPLATILLAAAQRVEPLEARGIAGALIALLGIVVVFAGSARGGTAILPLLALVGAALCFGQAGIVVKRFPPVHPLAMNAMGMAVGAALLLVLSLGFREAWTFPTRAANWTALAYLIVVGSLGMFAVYLFVLARWTASGASYSFVLVPFVAVALGALLRDERLAPAHFLGGALVLAGVYIGALHGRRRTERTGRAAGEA